MIRIALMILAAVVSSAAVAQPEDPSVTPRSERVAFADLDLASAAGQTALQRRIQGAADRVCDVGGMMDVEQFLESTACYRTAYADGIRQMRQIVASRSSGAAMIASALVIGRK